MNQLQKYVWLIDTIRRAGRISYKDISDKWERRKDLSDYRPLHRATFNRWRDAVYEQFGIIIECQKAGGYLYYIANPEDINEDRLRKWMLDSFATGNAVGDYLSLKGRIVIDEIPSGREYLTPLLEAMKDDRVARITYRSFGKACGCTFPVEPYCVKLFENRWYVLARNIHYGDIRLYGLDRIEAVELTDDSFKLPEDFDAGEYFSTAYGIVMDNDAKPERIVVRASGYHRDYLKTLPLHHSQRLIEDCGEYADFELYLSPTYDFVMKLLQAGAMIEVIRPQSLRRMMKGWISDMYGLYEND